MEASSLKRLQKALKKAKSPLEKFNAYEDLAEYYYNKRDYENCLPYFEQELDAAETLLDELKIARAHRMIGEVLCMLCNYKDALRHQKKYYEYACEEKANRLVEQQRALTTLGRTFFLYGESTCNTDFEESKRLYSRADTNFLKSLEVCDKLEENGIVSKSDVNEMRAISLLNRGLVYESLMENEKAKNELDLALRVSRTHSLPSLQRKCCLNLATLLVRMDRIQDAFKLFKEAISSLKSLPDHERGHAEREVLEAEEEAHIKLGDVSSARKVLQRAYSIKSASFGDKQSIEEKLKSDVAMDYALRKLESDSLSPEEEMRLYEKLGDGFSARRVHNHAFNYYEKMLQCCKRGGLDPKPCYLSLAQTARDLRKYDVAISYFEEEITVSTPKDACQTLLLILECQELTNTTSEKRLKTVNRAWALAQNTNEPRLKIKVLKELEKIQRELGDSEFEKTNKTIQNLREFCIGSSSDSDDDQIVEGTPNIGDHIDLDALSDCSLDGFEREFEILENTLGTSTVGRPKRNCNRQRANVSWKNEKGETKLHLACIRGNVNSVQTLLEQGCEVNATDNAGWTPLHEACNHGHLEIVEMLLDRGANINHKGSGSVTPLHDAASAGNFEVMDILLKRNASLLTTTAEGQTPLDALKDYKKRTKRMQPEEEEQYNQMVKKLEAALDKVGHIPKDNQRKQRRNSSSSDQQDSHCENWDTSRPMGTLRRCLDSDTVDVFQRSAMRDISPTSKSSRSSEYSPQKISSDDEEEGRRGVSEYQNAMKSLRKNAQEEIPREPRKSIPSLIPETENVDEWLDDDLKSRPPPKRRRTVDSKLTASNFKPVSLHKTTNNRLSLNSRSSSRASSNASRNSVGSFGSHEDISSGVFMGSRTKMSPDNVSPLMWDDENLDIQMTNEEFVSHSAQRFNPADEPAPHIYCSTPRAQRQVTLSSFGVTRNIISPPQPAIQPMSQTISNLINVRVEDILLAIPVINSSCTVEWLKEEAAKRFYSKKGMQPKLEIQTAEGACVADDDPVSFFLGGSNLIGIVKDVAVLTDRYKDACKFDGIELNKTVLLSLEQSQVTHDMTIVNLTLPLQVLKPAFKAIAMERSLVKINLSNNSIGDEGLEVLCEHLERLSNLKDFDLSSNGLSSNGMKALVRAANIGHLKSLAHLNLSFNDLHNTCVSELSQLTAAVRGLQSLSLADCHFTKHMWDGHNHLLTLSSLKSLDLSGNLLESRGVAGWLGYADHDKGRRLNADVLEVLKLNNVGGSHVCQEIVLFMDNAEDVALNELSISYSDMQDADLYELLRALASSRKFRTFCVPAAPKLSGAAVCQVLSRRPPLSKVEIKIDPTNWKNMDARELIKAAGTAAQGIENLTLKGAPDQFENIWKTARGVYGSVRKGKFGVQVFQTMN